MAAFDAGAFDNVTFDVDEVAGEDAVQPKGRKRNHRRALAEWRRLRKQRIVETPTVEPVAEPIPIALPIVAVVPRRIAAQADFTALEAELDTLRAQIAQGEEKRFQEALILIEAAFAGVQAELRRMDEDDAAWLGRLIAEDEFLLLAA